jgi:hypothetical protein
MVDGGVRDKLQVVVNTVINLGSCETYEIS